MDNKRGQDSIFAALRGPQTAPAAAPPDAAAPGDPLLSRLEKLESRLASGDVGSERLAALERKLQETQQQAISAHVTLREREQAQKQAQAESEILMKNLSAQRRVDELEKRLVDAAAGKERIDSLQAGLGRAAAALAELKAKYDESMLACATLMGEIENLHAQQRALASASAANETALKESARVDESLRGQIQELREKRSPQDDGTMRDERAADIREQSARLGADLEARESRLKRELQAVREGESLRWAEAEAEFARLRRGLQDGAAAQQAAREGESLRWAEAEAEFARLRRGLQDGAEAQRAVADGEQRLMKAQEELRARGEARENALQGELEKLAVALGRARVAMEESRAESASLAAGGERRSAEAVEALRSALESLENKHRKAQQDVGVALAAPLQAVGELRARCDAREVMYQRAIEEAALDMKRLRAGLEQLRAEAPAAASEAMRELLDRWSTELRRHIDQEARVLSFRQDEQLRACESRLRDKLEALAGAIEGRLTRLEQVLK